MDGFILIILTIALYFIPTFVAYRRQHSKISAIFVLNLLLGWAVLGWIIALIWSYTEDNNLIIKA